MGSSRRILALIVKEFLAILKDPRSRFVVIGPPIIQFFVFGYAATYDVRQVRYAVLDESRTPESRELLAHFAGADSFKLVRTLHNDHELEEVVDSQEARLVLRLGPTFAEDLHAGRQAALQVILDGRNSNVALVAQGYVGEVVEAFGRAWVARHQTAGPPSPALRLVTRAWYNPNLLSRWFMVSALGGQISMVIVMVLASLSVAREREHGTFDQLLVTPFTPVEILIGKAAPALVFGLLDALLLAVAGVLWFGLPFLGSVPALLAGLSVFVVATTGVGLFVSSVSTTMQQALLGSFMVIMPAVILSGFTTPIENMPDWLQTLTLANPLRYVVVILRRVMLEGAALADVWHELLPMALIAGVTLSSATWLFRRRSQ